MGTSTKTESRSEKSIQMAQMAGKERKDIIQKEVLKMQEESKRMTERYLEESKRRASLLQKEQEARESEEKRKAELMAQRMAEQEEKEKHRKAELKRQDSLL